MKVEGCFESDPALVILIILVTFIESGTQKIGYFMNGIVAAFIKGILFGMTMAIIPGPIFFLIVQRTLNDGPLVGLLCGLGAASADTVYALIAALGLTLISQFLLDYQAIISILGGIFLLYLGLKTYMRRVMYTRAADVQKKGLFNAWLSTFLLTLTNPVTIISYTVMFAGLGVGTASLLVSLSLVSGVILGAFSIVVLLVGFLQYFTKKVTPEMLLIVNKIAGFILIGFGIMAILRGLLH